MFHLSSPFSLLSHDFFFSIFRPYGQVVLHLSPARYSNQPAADHRHRDDDAGHQPVPVLGRAAAVLERLWAEQGRDDGALDPLLDVALDCVRWGSRWVFERRNGVRFPGGGAGNGGAAVSVEPVVHPPGDSER